MKPSLRRNIPPLPLARLAVLPLLAAAAAQAQTAPDCAAEADDRQRLACYDRLFRPAAPAAPASAAPAALPAPPPAAAAVAPPRRDEPTWQASTALDRMWELTPETKRGTFTVRTHQPNFVLPLHYTSEINRAPSSPTHAAPAGLPRYRPLEAKLQVSLRAKVAEGLLLPEADLWFAYTQRSLWQVWNQRESSPFRSTDYQPEAIYVVPVPASIGTLPGGWRWRMAQLGVAHQSNGQADPLSRSWNRIWAGMSFDRGNFALSLRGHSRLKESSDDDNPDLTRYIGSAEVVASWLPGRSTASLTWRTDPRSLKRGSLALDWTHPVSSERPNGLRWHVQLFTGYGETLLDYNHRQTTLGLGLALFQF